MKKTIFILLSWAMMACSSDEALTGNNPITQDPVEWLVPKNEVFDGGPGKDGIPSIDDPQFTLASQVNYLDDNDLILGIRSGDIIKAYPHPILDWHEIVNDQVDNTKFSITYCPLTGTGIGWNRVIEGVETTFGVSGLLYNTNLMPYDRATNSTWSQQRLDCVNGELLGLKAETYSLIETTWTTWKNAYPSSLVLNTETGFSRNYGIYPYGNYRSNNSRLLFPVSNTDGRLPQKERTLGVLYDQEKRVYPFDDGQETIDIIFDDLAGRDLAIVRSKAMNFIVAFEVPEGVNLSLVSDAFPTILVDDSGTMYDVLGYPVSEGSGDRLHLAPQFIGYWFSWPAFYAGIDLWVD